MQPSQWLNVGVNSFIRGRQSEETIREEYFGTGVLDCVITDFLEVKSSKINSKWKCTKSHNLPKKSKVRLHGNHFLVLNDNITHVLLFSQFDWEENTLNLQKTNKQKN